MESSAPKMNHQQEMQESSSTLESVNIQDKTFNEFSRGQDTYDTMKKSAELTESLYWFDGGRHFMTEERLSGHGEAASCLEARFGALSFSSLILW